MRLTRGVDGVPEVTGDDRREREPPARPLVVRDTSWVTRDSRSTKSGRVKTYVVLEVYEEDL